MSSVPTNTLAVNTQGRPVNAARLRNHLAMTALMPL